MMPNMDGRAFRAEQLRDPGLSPIPVVIVSAVAEVEKAAEELQVAAHVTKPFPLEDLVEIVDRFCAARRELIRRKRRRSVGGSCPMSDGIEEIFDPERPVKVAASRSSSATSATSSSAENTITAMSLSPDHSAVRAGTRAHPSSAS